MCQCDTSRISDKIETAEQTPTAANDVKPLLVAMVPFESEEFWQLMPRKEVRDFLDIDV